MPISNLLIYLKSFYKLPASLYEGNLGLLKIEHFIRGYGKLKYTTITVVKSPFIYSKAKEQFTQTYYFGFISYFQLNRILSSLTLSRQIILSLVKSNKIYTRGYSYKYRLFW